MTTEEQYNWVNDLKIGDLVHDCRGLVLKIKEISGKGYHCQIVLEDDAICSAMNCCSPVNQLEREAYVSTCNVHMQEVQDPLA